MPFPLFVLLQGIIIPCSVWLTLASSSCTTSMADTFQGWRVHRRPRVVIRYLNCHCIVVLVSSIALDKLSK
jgi:hypothetical protein